MAELVSEGIRTGRGRRAAYLHRDRVNGRLRGRRGARLAALTSGGAIPELGDYRVLAEPDDTLVGTVNEDWAIESMAGDVFLLGTHSWRIRRVEPGIVRVVDAEGAPPSVPFWLGEAPGRTRGAVRGGLARSARRVADRAGRRRRRSAAVAWLAGRCGLDAAAADDDRGLPGAPAGRSSGCCPRMDTIVLERFFDEAGGMQLVGHAPFGARINRALGLALRKRFCVTFDFELQAAASDDAIVLSLGPQHSFPLDRVPQFLASATVEDVVRQAVLHLADVRGPLAVEPEPVAGRAADARRQEEPARHPADGGRRPDGRGVPHPGRLPGERGPRPAGDPRPPAGPPDAATTACTRRWTSTACRELLARHRVGPGQRRGAGHHRAVGARPRDPERPAVHVPRRRPARGAAQPGGAAAPRPAGRAARAGPARPRRHRAGAPPRSGRTRGTPTSCTTC